MTAIRPRCAACGDRVSVLIAHRWERHTYCSLRCLEPVKFETLKVRYDLEDTAPVVCRCAGPPRPLEPQGPHCADCRRMFSASVRDLLRHPRELRHFGRLRSLLYMELPVPRWIA